MSPMSPGENPYTATLSTTQNCVLMVGCSSHLAYERWAGSITDVRLYNVCVDMSKFQTSAPTIG